MNLWHIISGYISFRIITADYIGLMNQFNELGITQFNIRIIDALTIEIDISGKEYPKAKAILDKRGDEYELLYEKGISYKLRSLLHRPVLLIGIAMIVFLVFYTPSRVFFVNVTGNQIVPESAILEKASTCGIRFGASRKLVRSEKVKNQLISQLPQLQWVGVNTDGCVATIHVTEKSRKEHKETMEKGISSIVASRDGVILTCTVLQGTPVCKPGQAVKQGETLVSGYTDCGICVQATRAKAEVLAQTTRSLTLIAPGNMIQRGRLLSSDTDYSLRIGKKLINFRKDSGIPDATCVKMYKESHMVLPGGFVLPVSLITKNQTYYELVSVYTSDYSWLNAYAAEYLKSQMISGQILQHETRLQCSDSAALFEGKYYCTEMIGQTKQEEIIDGYGCN